MIVNKIDLLETADEQQEVLEFVSSSAQSLLGSESKVFGLSARMAKHAISSSASTNTRQNGSGLDLLEEYIDEKLDSVERFRLKLKASASVGTTLAEKYTSVLSSNQAVVESDRKMLREIDMLLERHEDNVRKAYPAYFARVDNALMNLSERIDFFFNTHTRMSNFWTLSYSSSVEQAFEEEVVKGTSKTIQRQIQAVAEWISDMSSRNLTEVTATFSRRVGERAREISTLREKAEIESEKSSLDFSAFPSGREIEVSSNREGLVTRITERAGDLANDHISGKEGKRIADGIASSVRVSTGLGIGTIGYLAASVVNSSGVALGLAVGDPTVSLLVGTIGVIGATALPRRRRVLRSELKAKIATIRTRLQNDLRGALEDQLSAHMIGIKGIIQPFSDFSEQQVHLLQQRRAGLSDSLEMLKKLQKRSDDMFSPTLDSKEGNEKT